MQVFIVRTADSLRMRAIDLVDATTRGIAPHRHRIWHWAMTEGFGIREIARWFDVAPSTVSRACRKIDQET